LAGLAERSPLVISYGPNDGLLSLSDKNFLLHFSDYRTCETLSGDLPISSLRSYDIAGSKLIDFR